MFIVFNYIYPYITNAFFTLMSSSHNIRSLNNVSIINSKKNCAEKL